MRIRISFKTLCFSMVCFGLIYLFISFDLVIGLGNHKENSSSQSSKSIFKSFKHKENHVYKMRNNVYDRGKHKQRPRIPIEIAIRRNYTVDAAVVKNDKIYDASVEDSNKYEGVVRNNAKGDTPVRNENERGAVVRYDRIRGFAENNDNKRNTVVKDHVLAGINIKHNVDIRNDNKHDVVKRKHNRHDAVVRNNYIRYDKNVAIRNVDKHNTIFNNTALLKNTNEIVKQKPFRPLNGSIYLPLQYIPKEKYIRNRLVPHISGNTTAQFLSLPTINYTQPIAIVSPVRNSEWSLETFKDQLAKLNYPHHLMSVYFGESGSSDKTFEKAINISKYLKKVQNFRDARVIRLQLSGGIQGPKAERHKKVFQKYRRAHIAAVRNRLVQYVLQHGKFEQVLSIDSDLKHFPPDLVQQMLFAKSDVVVTPCLKETFNGMKSIYDCNSWRETKASLEKQKHLSPDVLVLECYAKPDRIYLSYLKSEGRVVKVDGVGGCALMVKADCFQSGLLFPEVVYKHHIETEGLAKMALDMGYSVVGLPFVEVFHP
ncbi:uncharacterized protein LOC132716781 [Ruditapes philippinarum]|uniref:uncharacterized protein LOC132716781 n=1 Tax=Ruditapes philippinarum TaxID=129788 RepID=UPI00295AFE1C|nr:uncharacterized protein LOC132716781 [Ruditapes philippinarum]